MVLESTFSSRVVQSEEPQNHPSLSGSSIYMLLNLQRFFSWNNLQLHFLKVIFFIQRIFNFSNPLIFFSKILCLSFPFLNRLAHLFFNILLIYSVLFVISHGLHCRVHCLSAKEVLNRMVLKETNVFCGTAVPVMTTFLLRRRTRTPLGTGLSGCWPSCTCPTPWRRISPTSLWTTTPVPLRLPNLTGKADHGIRVLF